MPSESDAREQMRQARLDMPRPTFEEAWAQHDAAERASLKFAQRNVRSSVDEENVDAAPDIGTSG